MFLVGSIVRIHHDAQSSECQISQINPVHFLTSYSILYQFHVTNLNWLAVQTVWRVLVPSTYFRAVYVSLCFHYLPLIKLVITGMMREVNEEGEAMLWLRTVNFMNVFGTASGIPSKYYWLRTKSMLMSERFERRNLISSAASFLVWQTLGARLW